MCRSCDTDLHVRDATMKHATRLAQMEFAALGIDFRTFHYPRESASERETAPEPAAPLEKEFAKRRDRHT